MLCLGFFLTGCATAPDFRGVRLAGQGQADPIVKEGFTTDLFKESGTRQVFATADIEYLFGEISSFWITVTNRSTTIPVNIDYRFSEFFLVTTDGQKRPLIIPEAYFPPSPRLIQPLSQATLQVRLGRPKVVREEIKMIECSFDLGKTRVFLFPNAPKFAKPQKSFLKSLFY